jgi:tRNA threonylcarbamoyladenosine biosynthesis protein TsaE
LGAGKTTFVKGLVSGLGLAGEEEVTSPSFVLVHAFRNHASLYHVDLYRIEKATELESLGLDDLIAEDAIVVVEWAERLALAGLAPAIRVHLDAVSDRERRIRVEGGS